MIGINFGIQEFQGGKVSLTDNFKSIFQELRGAYASTNLINFIFGKPVPAVNNLTSAGGTDIHHNSKFNSFIFCNFKHFF